MNVYALSASEKSLLNAFRDLRDTGLDAAEWRTLGKLAHAKALEYERQYESRFMKGVPGQLCLRIRIYNKGIIDRMHSIREKRNPSPEGVRDATREITGRPSAVENLAYELMIKGLETAEQELSIQHDKPED